MVAVLVPSQARATDTTAAPPRWPGSGERQLVLKVSGVPDAFLEPIRKAAAAWSRSPAVDITVEVGGTCFDFKDRLELCGSSYPDATWLGLTSVWVNGRNAIQYVTIEVNLAKTWTWERRRYVACHELGHALGLEHRAEASGRSCMLPSFGQITTSPAIPDETDLADLAALYA
jgi:predicted Zn-dependent protease